jgi:hypothetical protein
MRRRGFNIKDTGWAWLDPSLPGGKPVPAVRVVPAPTVPVEQLPATQPALESEAPQQPKVESLGYIEPVEVMRAGTIGQRRQCCRLCALPLFHMETFSTICRAVTDSGLGPMVGRGGGIAMSRATFTLQADVIAALSRATTEFDQLRVMRDAFLASMRPKGLRLLAQETGRPLGELKEQQRQARFRLAAARTRLSAVEAA